ncbi:hypothetical protein BDW66DRAFT_136769 [Aspergillus desertorum]
MEILSIFMVFFGLLHQQKEKDSERNFGIFSPTVYVFGIRHLRLPRCILWLLSQDKTKVRIQPHIFELRVLDFILDFFSTGPCIFK